MADRSHVTSLDAIESFRAKLIVFLSKARPATEEISNELVRMRVWLETDQRNYWDKELRLLGRRLEQAQQELFVARLSKLESASATQEMAVQRLKRKVTDAEDKQQMTRKWTRDLEDRSRPMVREIESLHHFLTNDMVRAAAYLAKVVKTLEAYAAVPQPGISADIAAAGPELPPLPEDGTSGAPGTAREGESL